MGLESGLPLVAFDIQLHGRHAIAKRCGSRSPRLDVAGAQDDGELGALGEATDDFKADSFV